MICGEFPIQSVSKGDNQSANCPEKKEPNITPPNIVSCMIRPVIKPAIKAIKANVNTIMSNVSMKLYNPVIKQQR